MVTMLPLIVLLLGFCLMLCLARSKWPGWMGLPFFVMVGSVVLGVGISPLAARFLGYRNVTIAGVAQPEEIPASIALILLNALMVTFGMMLAWLLWDRGDPATKFVSDVSYSPYVLSRTWNASLMMFLFGVLCNVLVLHFLLRDYSLLELAFARALFSAEIEGNAIYHYARLLSSTMVIGAWGMLLFSAESRIRMGLAAVANSAVVILQVLYGGRTRVIIALLAIMVLYHYGIKRMRLQRIVILAIAGLMGLFAIQLLRMQAGSFSDALLGIGADVLVSGDINEAAFALKMFPEQVPFLGWGVLVGGLSHLFPTLGKHIPWAGSIWMSLVKHLFGGQNPMSGIGGEHYAPAAEHYMQFGLSGVIFLGLAIGLFYGRLFTWQKQQPRNLFLLMFTTYTFLAFFVSVMNGKMATWVGGMGFAVLLPVGVLASMRHGRLGSELSLAAPLFLCASSFFSRHLFGWEIFDYTFAVALLIAYLICVKLIGMANPGTERTQNEVDRGVMTKAEVLCYAPDVNG